MAVRINVTAVRDGPPAEVRAVMSEVLKPVCKTDDCRPLGDLLNLAEHGGWVSFTTSVWGVSAGDLNRGLCRLARPAAQFTTSDGSRWYLTVHGGPTGQVHFLHDFGVFGGDPDPANDAEREDEFRQRDESAEIDPALRFLEDAPPPGADRPRTAFDSVADDVGGVTDEFRAAVAGLPYSGAVAKLRRWHADQVLAALAAANIPFDEPAAHRALLWEGLTDAESGSDLGNLPRLLVALGLGGEWDAYIQQAETPPAEQPAECVPEADATSAEPPTDLFGPVSRLTDAVTLSPVAGGPVPLKFSKLSLVSFLPEALTVDGNPGAVVTVTLPAGAGPGDATVPTEYSDGQAEVLPDGFRVAVQDGGSLEARFLKPYLGKRLAKLFANPPAGTVVDVAFAAEGHPALTQRYRGPVVDGEWRIAETYPPLAADDLAGGLELARRADKDTQRVRDEAEADAIEAATQRDPDLRGGKFLRDGLKVGYEYDFNGGIAKAILRHRHGAAFDLAAYERAAAAKVAEQRERERAMRRAGAEAARRRAAPHDAEILLRGRCGPYWRSDFLQLTELEQETRQAWDAALTSLGFAPIGDLVAKKQRDIVLRVHGSADGSCYAIMMAKRTMYLGTEFVSRFADDSMLTTTTNGSVDSLPEAGIFYKVCGGLDAAALFAKHRWGQERFRDSRGTASIALPMTLGGVAEELDAAFARRAAVESRESVVVEAVPLDEEGMPGEV